MTQLYRKVLPNEPPRPEDQVLINGLWVDSQDLPEDFVITPEVEIRRPIRLASESERLLDEGEVYSMTDIHVSDQGKGLVSEEVAGAVNHYVDFSQDLDTYVVRPLAHTILLDDAGEEYTLDTADLPALVERVA